MRPAAADTRVVAAAADPPPGPCPLSPAPAPPWQPQAPRQWAAQSNVATERIAQPTDTGTKLFHTQQLHNVASPT